MSPELETLDQLLGGDQALGLVRGYYADDSHFARAIRAMLDARELRLLTGEGGEVPRWQRREVLSAVCDPEVADQFKLSITDLGAERIG